MNKFGNAKTSDDDPSKSSLIEFLEMVDSIQPKTKGTEKESIQLF